MSERAKIYAGEIEEGVSVVRAKVEFGLIVAGICAVEGSVDFCFDRVEGVEDAFCSVEVRTSSFEILKAEFDV